MQPAVAQDDDDSRLRRELERAYEHAVEKAAVAAARLRAARALRIPRLAPTPWTYAVQVALYPQIAEAPSTDSELRNAIRMCKMEADRLDSVIRSIDRIVQDHERNAGVEEDGESRDRRGGNRNSSSSSDTPDLNPSRLDAPSRAARGQRIRVTFRVKNDGKGKSRRSTARIRISQNRREVTSQDPALTTIQIPALDPREQKLFEEEIQIPAILSQGSYYLWLIVDVDSVAGQTARDERNDKVYERITIE